jgi:hypothetical protein
MEEVEFAPAVHQPYMYIIKSTQHLSGWQSMAVFRKSGKKII